LRKASSFFHYINIKKLVGVTERKFKESQRVLRLPPEVNPPKRLGSTMYPRGDNAGNPPEQPPSEKTPTNIKMKRQTVALIDFGDCILGNSFILVLFSHKRPGQSCVSSRLAFPQFDL